MENAIDAGGTASHNVLVEHHEGHAAIPIEGMRTGKVTDALLLVDGEPVIAGDPGIVLVDLAEAVDPIAILAGADADPEQKV